MTATVGSAGSRSSAVGVVTTAERPVSALAGRLSCTAGSHPGYPSGWRDDGWPTTTTRAQSPRVSRTLTRSP